MSADSNERYPRPGPVVDETGSVRYQNRYGSVRLVPVTPYGPVSGYRTDTSPPELLVSLDDAERIALITENRRVNYGFNLREGRGIIIHHEGPNRAAVCRVEDLAFTRDLNPTDELGRLNQMQSIAVFGLPYRTGAAPNPVAGGHP